MKKKVLLSFGIILLSYLSFAQSNVKDSTIVIPSIYGEFAFQFPGGDLVNEFSSNGNVGGGFMIKTKRNFVFGLKYNYLFGNDVKNETTLLKDISTSNGYVISSAGTYVDIHMYENGTFLSAKFGKIFNVLAPNKNSGIIILGGLGFFQHKIRIDVAENNAYNLDGDYKRGYDRLTYGPGISEFIGYIYYGNSKLVNFFFGFEFVQAWTKNRRDFNFDTMSKDDSNRFETLSGFKVGWIIPIFNRAPKDFYYY